MNWKSICETVHSVSLDLLSRYDNIGNCSDQTVTNEELLELNELNSPESCMAIWYELNNKYNNENRNGNDFYSKYEISIPGEMFLTNNNECNHNNVNV